MRAMEKSLEEVDCYVCPSYGGDNLLANNLTGHPCLVAPNGFTSQQGTPTSITFVGRLHGESDLLALGTAWQEATPYHSKRPPLV
jgi:Asp-tRNA(Asn)/Glu-tRNA(Gln) amidotransferase A subunit family amidase